MKLPFVLRTCLIAAFCIRQSGAANQILLRYLDLGDPGHATAITSDHAGNLFAVSAITDVSGRTLTRVIKTDPNGLPLASFDFAATFYTAATTDTQGNLIIVGSADSHGFPLTARVFPPATDVAAFVLKLDSGLHGILFSRVFATPSAANAVALDQTGNIFVAGNTSASNFPITPGAYQTKPPVGDSYGTPVYAFLTEISSDGSRLLYSTYFGSDAANCQGGSSCLGVFGYTSATALALDQSGAVVMAGSTDAPGLPVTPGALNGTCVCPAYLTVGFVAKLALGQPQQLVWSTFLNGAEQFSSGPSSILIHAVALDSSGGVVLGGIAGDAIPTTPGVVQPVMPPLPPTGFLNNGFITKVDSSGTRLVWSTYFGSFLEGGVNALGFDPQGNIVAAGYANAESLPAFPGKPSSGGSYVARLSGDGTSPRDLYVGPDGATGQALTLTSTGKFVALGTAGSLWIETGTPGPSLLATANMACGLTSGLAAPDELMSLSGIGIGPPTALGGQIGTNGAFTSSLGGYQVFFDGIAAPLLSAGPMEIDAIVPSEVFGQDSTHIKIVSPSATIDGPVLALRPSVPCVFQNAQTGLAAALNQDGSVNSPQNPAKRGSIVSIFASGGGVVRLADGQLANSGVPAALPVAVLGGVNVFGGLTSLEVEYAGDAPDLVAGVMQVNFRLPDVFLAPAGTFDFQLQVGSALAPVSTIAVSH